jgi:hypothetical protein
MPGKLPFTMNFKPIEVPGANTFMPTSVTPGLYSAAFTISKGRGAQIHD